jgi:hypothetical protein
MRMTDVTAADIAMLLKETRICSLCSVRMTGLSGQPSSKHVDHVVPICVGGTHTFANLRVICARCNLSRPKDGSDVVGQVSLWSAHPAFARKQRRVPEPGPQRVGKYAHLEADIRNLRAEGHGYKRIARTLGIRRDTARDLVKRMVPA